MKNFLNCIFNQNPVIMIFIMTYPFIIGIFYLVTTFAL